MRIDKVTPIVQIEPAILNELVKEIKETLATNLDLATNSKPLFTSVNMWSIRKNARTASSRFNA